MTLSSSSFSQPSDKIEIIFSEKAREELDKIKTKEVTERLPLLIETLKELDCCRMNTIEILKNVHQDDKRVYSGRLNKKDRLHAVRTIKDGRVTKIEILSILGHTK